MSPRLTGSFSTYLRYPHLRSSNSPEALSAKDMQHHAVAAYPPQHWSPGYPKDDHPHPFPVSECADCSTGCTEPMCSTANEITPQCTDQCVVITCNDPDHSSLTCTDGHSYCDFACDGTTHCTDCDGFDALMRCCEEYHPCYVHQTRPTDLSQQLPQQTIVGQYHWNTSPTATLCDCGHSAKAKTHLTTSATSLSQPATPAGFPPAIIGNNPRYSPYSLPSFSTAYNSVSQPFSPVLPNQMLDSQAARRNTSDNQLHQAYPLSSSSSPLASLTCMWDNCQEQLSSLRDLVGHVNLTHLRSPADPGCPTDCDHPLGTHAHMQAVHDTTRLPCLWGDCTEYLEPQLLSKSSDGNAMDVIQLALANHLFQEHLKLYSSNTSYLGDTSEDDWLFAELMASSQQEQGQQGQTLQQSQYNKDDRDNSTAANSTSNSASAQNVQEEDTNSNACQQSDAPTTPSLTIAATAPDSPTISIEEIPPTEGHTCRWEACRMTFETCHDLMAHMSAVHVGSGKAQYDCLWEGCARNGNKGFSSKQKISRHLQSHTGYRPFQCPECLQNFSESATLQQHTRRHTQEKPYKCDFPGCGKSFAITGALTIHRRIHNGLKPFKCSYCGRGFAESSNLSKHLRTHTGERPYICAEPSCRKAFARPDQLTRHMAVHRKKAVTTTAVVLTSAP